MAKIIFHAKKSAAPDFSKAAGLLNLHISYQRRNIIWTHSLTWI